MKLQDSINFNRIANAIEYLRENYQEQPNLDEIASKVHLSPFHFQKLFTEWAGVSPKKFLQYISLNHAKKILKEENFSLSETSYHIGLSGSSRLHDLFVNIEGMTPGTYKNGGQNLILNYSFAESPFGDLMVASTPKGVCHLTFIENQEEGLSTLISKFPNAKIIQKLDLNQQNALSLFRKDWTHLPEIKLHLKGTDFQLKVWESLIKIPMGKLTTYGNIAARIERPKAHRAVGTAVGNNPVAYVIPCHRVIQASGKFGQYHWGSKRKNAMIGWEAIRSEVA